MSASRLRRFASLLWLALPFIGASTSSAPAAPRAHHVVRTPAASTEHDAVDRAESAVVLVVLDGVRWQEVFRGADRAIAELRGYDVSRWTTPEALMPNVHAFAATRGTIVGAPGRGEDIAASGPNFVSLPAYIEIFSGRAAPTCADNRCPPSLAPTIVDVARDAFGANEDVAVFASWPNIARAAAADTARVVLSTGRHTIENAAVLRADDVTAQALAHGADASAWPGTGDYRPDAWTARIALGYLEARRPRFLFVSLGDTDEYAHRNDYRGYLEALRAADAFLGQVLAALHRMGERGRRTTVVLTTDHGRAYGFQDHGRDFPESARVWLVAGGGDVDALDPKKLRKLADVAPLVASALGLPWDTHGRAP
jgi:hypothetical protein